MTVAPPQVTGGPFTTYDDELPAGLLDDWGLCSMCRLVAAADMDMRAAWWLQVELHWQPGGPSERFLVSHMSMAGRKGGNTATWQPTPERAHMAP